MYIAHKRYCKFWLSKDRRNHALLQNEVLFIEHHVLFFGLFVLSLFPIIPELKYFLKAVDHVYLVKYIVENLIYVSHDSWVASGLKLVYQWSELILTDPSHTVENVLFTSDIILLLLLLFLLLIFFCSYTGARDEKNKQQCWLIEFSC